MTQNRNRDRDKSQAKKEAEFTPDQAALPAKPSLIEGTETKVIYYKPEEDKYIPKSPKTRWLYHRAQIILSALTFAILVIYFVQWLEFRASRQIENRAYVAAAGVTFELANPVDPSVMGLWVTCLNNGRTPGINGNILTVLERRQGSPPEDQVINQPDAPPSRIIFGSQTPIKRLAGTQPNFVPPPPTPAPVDSKGKPVASPSPVATPTPGPVDTDKRLFYLYGVISYDDIFGAHHRTKFCFQTAVGNGIWSYCPTFNDAD